MKREEFDRILIEEDITSEKMKRDLWRTRLANDLNERKLRNACKMFKKAYPWACDEKTY